MIVSVGFYNLLFPITLCFSTISISRESHPIFFFLTALWCSVVCTCHDLFNPLHGGHLDWAQYFVVINKEQEGFFPLYFHFLKVISFNVLVHLLPRVLGAQVRMRLTRYRCKFVCLFGFGLVFFSFIYLPLF